MTVVKTHAKGQIVIPKEIRKQLGIIPGKAVSIKLVNDHAEIKPLPDDPIEHLTGIFEMHPTSMSEELLKERKKDNAADEKNTL